MYDVERQRPSTSSRVQVGRNSQVSLLALPVLSLSSQTTVDSLENAQESLMRKEDEIWEVESNRNSVSSGASQVRCSDHNASYLKNPIWEEENRRSQTATHQEARNRI